MPLFPSLFEWKYLLQLSYPYLTIVFIFMCMHMCEYVCVGLGEWSYNLSFSSQVSGLKKLRIYTQGASAIFESDIEILRSWI